MANFKKNYLLLFLFIFTIILSPFAQTLSVEKIWKEYQFYPKGFSGFNGMKDGLNYTKLVRVGAEDRIVVLDYSGKNIEKEIFNNKNGLVNGTGIAIDSYYFNSDESKILIATNTESIYRRSYNAEFYLFDAKSSKFEPLDPVHSPQTLAEYSPDGNKVAYIHKNNIYIKNLTDGKVTQVTQDGAFNNIINGTTDWVYEEEFSITKAFDWSPDSKNIAYLKFNESKVHDFTLTFFETLYPDPYTFKYPKAGEDNSKVSCMMYSLTDNKTQNIPLGEYEYIPRMKWSDKANQLVVQTLNRHQNHLKYYLVESENSIWKSKMFFEEEDKAYVEIDDNLLILADGKTILRTSESSGYNQIYALGFDGKSKAITKGDCDVIEFLGVDEQDGQVFFTASSRGAINKAIFKTDLNGKKTKLLSATEGWNDAEFAEGMKYFVKSFSDANTPPVYILCDAEGKELQVLEDNVVLRNKLKSFNLSKKEFIQLRGEECDLNAWIIKPANFDPTKKYPVYMNVYGGPGSNMVKNTWGGMDYMYHQLLAQNGYIIISVDPRGTMYRGADFKKSTYLQLGKLETEDIIAVAKNLGKLDYVDPSRIGIMGWSYGGFMSSLAMTKGKGTFKMGIAVAPVTNWRYYDNIYTERFMRTPEENAKGYDDNSPINFVNDLQGNYLLIHGSGDDNVHYQNTMEMTTALVEADKQFDLFIYPNKNHGIYGGNTRNHLFNMMFEYTLKNL